MKYLQETDYKKYDYNFLTTFIERVSQNYIQHEVLLNDGRLGKILMINKGNLTKPLVKIDNLFVDLAKQKDLYIEKILL